MKLYYFVGACSLADHIVLEWTGAPYEAVRMTRETVKSPEFLTLSPYGTVPVLADGDFVLTQNAAILTYLADLHPEAALMGDGTPRGRAEVMRWLGFLNSDLHTAFKPIFAPAHFTPDSAAAGALADTARAHVRTDLNSVDRRIDDRRWLTGQRSIADPYLFVMLRWAARLKLGIEGFANLARFMGRMYDDDAVRAALLAEEGSDTYEARSEGVLHEASQTLRGFSDLRLRRA
jgi:glutathione S-transferase